MPGFVLTLVLSLLSVRKADEWLVGHQFESFSENKGQPLLGPRAPRPHQATSSLNNRDNVAFQESGRGARGPSEREARNIKLTLVGGTGRIRSEAAVK